MNLREINDLAMEYGNAIQCEMLLRRDVAEIERRIAETGGVALARHYAEGRIDGKNASARDAQEAQALFGNDGIAALRETLADIQEALFVMSGHVKTAEAKIKMIIALLNSQRESNLHVTDAPPARRRRRGGGIDDESLRLQTLASN